MTAELSARDGERRSDSSGGGSDGAMSRLFDTLREAASDEVITIGDVVDAIGSRGAGPFLVVPALAAISPIATIPGVPTTLAVVIVLFAAQILLGRERLWLPGFVRNRRIKASRVEKALDWLQPVADRMDRLLARRLTWAAGPVATRVAAAVVILLCLGVPPLELLPLAVILPMAAIALIGLAMMVQDGVVMIAGLVLSLAAVAAGLGFFV